MEVRSRVAEQSLPNGPLRPNSHEGPPPVGPGVAGALTQKRGGFPRLKRSKLADNVSGILAPAAEHLATKHHQGSLLRRGDVRVRSALAGFRVA